MTLLFLGGGLWVIPLVTLLGGLVFLYQSYKASKSGSVTHASSVTGRKASEYSDKNIPIHKTGGKFYFAVALFIATAVILLLMYSDK